MVRLTADLVWKSPHFFNAIKERELDLRGNKIAVIENVGTTEERIEAANLFASKVAEEEAKKVPAKTFTPGEVPDVMDVAKVDEVPKVVAPTPEQITAIKAAIVNAQTLEEVARLDKALQSGQIPADFIIPGNNDTDMASVPVKDDKMDTDAPKESKEDEKEMQNKAQEDQTQEQHDGPVPMQD